MESEAPTLLINQTAKLAFASEFSQLAQKIFDFYTQNQLFFIPNDLLESIAGLLGYYLVDSYPRNTAHFENNRTFAKKTISSHTAQGYKLAKLFKSRQENLSHELQANQHFNEADLIRARTVLDINFALGQVLMVSNKNKDLAKPSATTETAVTNFICNQLYPELKTFLIDLNSVNPAQKSAFILAELSIYIGWISGFYANLLETSEKLFVTYCNVSIDLATSKKSLH